MGVIRLGVVGPGLIWKNQHEPAMSRVDQAFRPTVFCATSERSRAEVAARYPDAPFVTSYSALVQRDDIDAVVVLTPIALNAPVALAALNAGKDVIMEKPMARTRAEAVGLMGAAARNRKRLWVLEQEAYDRRWRVLHGLLQDGELGELVTYDVVDHLPFGEPEASGGGYAYKSWRVTSDFPLGTFFDGGHHLLAMLATLFGRPDWVFATGISSRPEYGEYSHLLVQFGYPGGLRGSVSHSSDLVGYGNHCMIHGTSGMANVTREDVTIYQRGGLSRTISLPSDNSHQVMWQALASACAEGREADYGPGDAFRELATLLAVERSAKTGVRVAVE